MCSGDGISIPCCLMFTAADIVRYGRLGVEQWGPESGSWKRQQTGPRRPTTIMRTRTLGRSRIALSYR